MRARESCRPSALPLKVGRKPKLTSNKVFEVVRGGSWGNCLLREGRLEERSCQLLLFDARLLSRTEQLGLWQAEDRLRPGLDLSGNLTFVSVGSQTQGLLSHSSWVPGPGPHLLRPSFLCNLSSASTLSTSCWLDFGFGNYWSYVGERPRNLKS